RLASGPRHSANRNESSVRLMVRPFMVMRRLVSSRHKRAVCMTGSAFVCYTRARGLIQLGEERTQRLRWIAAVVSGALDSTHRGPQQETTELESLRNRT